MNDRLSKDPAYRRLPTGRRTPNQHLSCWLARDHLLVVEGMGYSERYSRFDLRDIQAVLIQPSGARQIVAMVAGLAAVPALALVGLMLARWLGTRDNDYLVGLVLISAASLAPLVALAWAAGCGPLCHVRISTAVQVAKLPGLHQRTKARAFATALRDAAVALSPIAPASAAVAAPDAQESRPA